MSRGDPGGPVGEVPTAMATVDAWGVVTGWGEGARSLLGYESSEILGRPAAVLLAGKAPTVEERRPAEERRRWHGTVTLLHRDGTRVEVRLLAHFGARADGDRIDTGHGDDGRGDDGRGDRAGGDCTTGAGGTAGTGPESGGPADRDAHEWLIVSPLTGGAPVRGDDDLIRKGFVGSPCTMALYDEQLRLRRVNDDMERVLGLAEDDIRGLRLPEIVRGPYSYEVERRMRRALESGETQYVEFPIRLVGHDRASAWAVSLAPLRGEDDGRVRGVILSGHDMTRQYTARRRLRLVSEASTRIGSTLDIVRTAQELADFAVPVIADFVTVDLLPTVSSGGEPPDGPLSGHVMLRRVACRSVLEGCPEAVVPIGETDFYPDFSPAAECLLLQRGIMNRVTDPSIAQWAAQAPERSRSVRKFGIHSTMAVPLLARGTTLGVATFSRHRTPEPFEPDDLLMAEDLTARAAVCIDNARRYTRERDTALTLQRSLLPRVLPQHAAVEAAFRYLPAGSGAGVGGDWFDVIPLSSSRVALVVGDVVGHGLQASATMGRLRTAVRTLADVDLPPDELLTHLDDLVNRVSAEEADAPNAPNGRSGADGEDAANAANAESSGSTRSSGSSGSSASAEYAASPESAAAENTGDVGATCLYAVYDPVSRRCSLARAGHPQPVLVRPDGDAEFVDLPAGPPLGLGNLPFETAEIQLPEGSLLALYTNGLIDSRERGPDDTMTALREALARPAASLEELCDTVLETVLPARPADDVALLLARTRALDASQVVTWELARDPAVVARARGNVSDQLAAWGLDEAVFTTELVVSELVTNAIRYASAPIQLRLIHDRNLICEVSDGSNTAPHLRRARVFDEGGRGLLLVAQLTRSWGTRQGVGGKTIWAEQTLPVGEPALLSAAL
ncbi:SpoIIE family protein phosphatase [Streptomyces hebeiensis]